MAAFFGYGSLVNTQTHTFGGTPGRLRGWRRLWCATSFRGAAILSILPAPNSTLLGLCADVPGDDWAALDKREALYDRIDVSTQFDGPTAVYSVPLRDHLPADGHHILLSYLDVVLQGYLHQFGPKGPQHFMDTTDGWDIGIHDDRTSPQYPRAQHLTPQEIAMVDDLTATYRR